MGTNDANETKSGKPERILLTDELNDKMLEVMMKTRSERDGGMTEEKMNECFVSLFGRNAAERIKNGERDFLDPTIANFVEYMVRHVKLMNKMRRYMQDDD